MKQRGINIFQKFFQLSKQDGHATIILTMKINFENNGPFRVAGHMCAADLF